MDRSAVQRRVRLANVVRKVVAQKIVGPQVVARKIVGRMAVRLTRVPRVVPKGAVRKDEAQKRAVRKDEASEVVDLEVVDLEVGEEEAHVAVDSAQVVSDNVVPEGAGRWLGRQGSAAVRQGPWRDRRPALVVRIGSISGSATWSGSWMKSCTSCAS